MSSAVSPSPSRASGNKTIMKPVNQIFADQDGYSRTVDARTVLLDHAIEALEYELGHRIGPLIRPAVVYVLEQLARDWQ